MTQVSLCDQGAAFLAAGLVAKYDTVQSTRSIINIWDELRQNIHIDSRLDYLVALLTQGRLMDLRIKKGNYLKLAQDNMNTIRRELVIALTQTLLGEQNGTDVLAESYIVRLNDVASATITGTFIRISKKVETIKEIMDIWVKIRGMKIVNDNNEFLAVLFATSRMSDLRKLLESGGPELIFENFPALLSAIEPDLKVTKLDLAAAHITIAIVTQTPEIETNAEVVNIWKDLKTDLQLEDDDINIISAILTGGLIQNRTKRIPQDNIKEFFITIKGKLQEILESGASDQG